MSNVTSEETKTPDTTKEEKKCKPSSCHNDSPKTEEEDGAEKKGHVRMLPKLRQQRIKDEYGYAELETVCEEEDEASLESKLSE
eukprot:4548816-Ditylum_brightwellii.AAC.1